MATTTVRLDDDDEQLLDRLAVSFGGRSNAIRQALRDLAAEVDRQEALGELLADWDASGDPISEPEIEAMSRRYRL
jgi:predicted transcriptional regulator